MALELLRGDPTTDVSSSRFVPVDVIYKWVKMLLSWNAMNAKDASFWMGVLLEVCGLGWLTFGCWLTERTVYLFTQPVGLGQRFKFSLELLTEVDQLSLHELIY